MTKILIISAAALAMLPVSAQRAARMELPADLIARVERVGATGFGGWNEGRYTLGDLSGEFTRIESRSAVFDPLLAQNRGRSSFTIAGPGFDERLAGSCEMRRGTVTLGVITFDREKMTYECTLDDAGSAIAAVIVGEPEPKNLRARVLARAERRGEATFDGVTVGIRSVHRYAGSRLEAPMPVGYLFEIDGRAIGALELTDVDPAVYLPPAEPAGVRAAVVVAALALAVLRDPASSALEE